MNKISIFVDFLKQFWYVAVLVAVIVAGVVTKNWYDNKINESYNNGVMVTDQKWKSAQKEKDRLTTEFKNNQQAKVDRLSKELAQAKQDLADQKRNGGEKQIVYVNSPQGKAKCLDDNYIDIYNDSLGK